MGMIHTLTSDLPKYRPIRYLESKKYFICYSSCIDIRDMFCSTWSYGNYKGILVTHLIALTHTNHSFLWLILMIHDNYTSGFYSALFFHSWLGSSSYELYLQGIRLHRISFINYRLWSINNGSKWPIKGSNCIYRSLMHHDGQLSATKSHLICLGLVISIILLLIMNLIELRQIGKNP